MLKNQVKSQDGMVKSGWIGAASTIAGAILHKSVAVINTTFGYEVWIPLFTIVAVGIYNELRGKKK